MNAVIAAAKSVAHHQRLDVLATRTVRQNLPKTPRDPRDNRLAKLVRVVSGSGRSLQQHSERFRVEFYVQQTEKRSLG